MAESPSIDSSAPREANEPEVSGEDNAALAWRILSSPTTLLVLTALLALVLAMAAALPQRPIPAELVRRLSFANADAAGGLGLLDVLVAWPTLLLLLLIALNAAGIAVARAGRRHQPDNLFVARASRLVPAGADEVAARLRALGLTPRGASVPGQAAYGRRGFAVEGAALAALGVVALLIGLVIARGSALDARMVQAPGSGALSEAHVRDGDLFLPSRLAYGVVCGRPDPQDPRRAYGCALAGDGMTTPLELSLAPGYTTSAQDLALSPLREEPRRFGDGEAYDLVLRRLVDGAEAVERLRLEPGTTIALRTTGDKLTAYAGPNGPYLVVEADGQPARALAPATLTPAPTRLPSGVAIEVEPATRLVIGVTSAPEAPLVLTGVLLFMLGLMALALVPHVEVALEAVPGGTRVTAWSSNRPASPEALLARLEGAPDALMPRKEASP